MDQHPSSTEQSGIIERVTPHINQAYALCRVACDTRGTLDEYTLNHCLQLLHEPLRQAYEAISGATRQEPKEPLKLDRTFDRMDTPLRKAQEELQSVWKNAPAAHQAALDTLAHHLARARALCSVACACWGMDEETLRLYAEMTAKEVHEAKQTLPTEPEELEARDEHHEFWDTCDGIDALLMKAQQRLGELPIDGR